MDEQPLPRILIRCDGGQRLGFGHVMRCLALAEELRVSHACHVDFAMREDLAGIKTVQRYGYPVWTPSDARDSIEEKWPKVLMDRLSFDAVVFDCRDAFSLSDITHLRKRGIIVATIDDVSERSVLADLAFLPPVPQVDEMDWTSFGGDRYVGWEWVLLRREVRDMMGVHTRFHVVPHLLISMGGSDPYGFTLKALRACYRLNHSFDVHVVLGPGFSAHHDVYEFHKSWNGSFHIHHHGERLLELMKETDLLIGAFGNTAYEAAVLDCFGIYLCGTADHAQSASQFMEAGFGISLGVGSQVSEGELSAAIQHFLDPVEQRRVLQRRHSYPGLDGLGAQRIARRLVQAIEVNHARKQTVARA